MTTFSYVALDPAGKKRTGFIEAADQDQAIAKIVAEGRFVLEIRADASGRGAASGGARKPTGRSGKVSRSDIALFT